MVASTRDTTSTANMTPYNEALNWILDTKEVAQSWSFGNNPREVRHFVSENRDAKGIADSFNYQVEMALHQAKSNEERTQIKDEYDELQAILDKRRDCLEVISQVSKMEDLFSTLTVDVDNTALELSAKSKSHFDSTKPALNIYSSQLVAENCMKSLQESWSYLQSIAHCSQVHLQNASVYHQFWHEVEESNEWLQYQLTRIPQIFSSKTPISGSTQQIKKTMSDMFDLLKDYLQWQTRLDILFERAKHVIPLKARSEKMMKSRQVQVMIDYKTKEFEVKEGQLVTLVDNSDSKKWRIRIDNSEHGNMGRAKSYSGLLKEVTVPAIIILIPPTEAAALDGALRLRLQMLALWSSTTKALGHHVTRILLEVFKDWNEEEKAEFGVMSESQRGSLLSLLDFMEKTLGYSVKGTPAYEQLVKKTTDITKSSKPVHSHSGDNHKVTIVVQVNYLHKFIQRYWDFWTYCDSYRIVLEQLRQPKNIFIYNNSSQMKYITTAHFVKFWDCDLEDRRWCVTVQEDSIQMDQTDSVQNSAVSAEIDEDEEETFYDSGATEQKTETEEVIESEMEVETTFVITGIVCNPGREPEEIISLQDAIDKGIIDPAQGLYVNKVTYASIPIPQAMNEGLIKMGPKKEKKSEEKVKSAGIITVRTTRETKPYVVQQALDTRTGEVISAKLAYVRGILDPDHGTYKDLEKGTVMLIGDAVQHRLVDIEYEPSDLSTVLEEISKTYLVHAVVCQRTKSKLPFHEAVQRGVIDKDSGAYLHNVTGEKFFVVDAINKGFIKATESHKPPSLHLGELGNMAVNEKVKTIRKKLLNPLKALLGMKGHHHSSDINTNNNNKTRSQLTNGDGA